MLLELPPDKALGLKMSTVPYVNVVMGQCNVVMYKTPLILRLQRKKVFFVIFHVMSFIIFIPHVGSNVSVFLLSQ